MEIDLSSILVWLRQIFLRKREKGPLAWDPPDVIAEYDYKYNVKLKGYKGFQEIASPLASCRIASTAGVRPLNMTSLRLIQRDHSVANMSCHSVTLRYGPSPMDHQKSSSDVSAGRATPTDHQTAREMEHNTKRCSQFSKVDPHNVQSPAELGAMRCQKDLIISR